MNVVVEGKDSTGAVVHISGRICCIPAVKGSLMIGLAEIPGLR